jgi:hypothetical protein
MLYRMHRPNMMVIGERDAKYIAAQVAANPRVLPAEEGCEAEDEDVEDDLKHYIMDKTEIAQMSDLLMRIFKWHPEQRATLDRIANHEWFGNRNRRWQPGVSSAPSARNNRARRLRLDYRSLPRRMVAGIRKGTYGMKKGWDRLAGTIAKIVAEVINLLRS